MSRRGGRTAARLSAGIAAALLLGGLAALPAGAAGAASAPPAPGAPTTVEDPDPAQADTGRPVEVAITDIDPVIGPGDDLHVTLRVRNDGAGTITRPRLLVHVARDGFISRSSLDRWRFADEDGEVGTAVWQEDLPNPLDPGQTVTVDVVVPASSVGLPNRRTAWGARGLAVQAVDIADPARVRLGLARTFLLWFPEQEVNATRLSVLAPVTGPAVDPLDGTWVPALEALTDEDGRLTALLDATADHPAVSWVVDPWLADPDNGAGPTARAWASQLTDAKTGREVSLLPYLDADITALAHAGAGDLLTTAIERAERTDTPLPLSARVSLAWPADVEPDLATVALADRTGHDALVVGPGTLPSPGVLTYTPSGRTTVTAGGEDVTVLVPDDRLSTAFVTGVVATSAPPAGDEPQDGEPAAAAPQMPDGVVTPATAAQDLLAELAVITRERPSDSRHVLVTVPRTWTPDAARVDAQLAALESAPWVQLEPVSALVGLPDPEVDRGSLPERAVASGEVDAATLGSVADAIDRRLHFVTIVADPTDILGDTELERLAPASVAWRSDPGGRGLAVQASHDRTRSLTGAVSVQQPPTPLNVVSSEVGLPVQVTNTFDRTITVEIGLRPYDRRLVADKTVPITLDPGASGTVQIPVHALQSADVRVAVVVLTPDGTVLNDDTEFDVRVRAEWESIGTAVLGGLLALGLVVGLVRTIRRGRTAHRGEPQVDSGPDALSPEEGEDLHSTSPAPDHAERTPDAALRQGRGDVSTADVTTAQEAPPT